MQTRIRVKSLKATGWAHTGFNFGGDSLHFISQWQSCLFVILNDPIMLNSSNLFYGQKKQGVYNKFLNIWVFNKERKEFTAQRVLCDEIQPTRKTVHRSRIVQTPSGLWQKINLTDWVRGQNKPYHLQGKCLLWRKNLLYNRGSWCVQSKKDVTPKDCSRLQIESRDVGWWQICKAERLYCFFLLWPFQTSLFRHYHLSFFFFFCILLFSSFNYSFFLALIITRWLKQRAKRWH